MKILQINSAKTFGGGERHLVDLIKGLTQRGHKVFLAACPNCDWLDKIENFPQENVFKIAPKNSLDVSAAKKIADVVRKNEIEIIHAHLARDYMSASVAVRFSPQAKLILTRHVLFSMKGMQKFALSNVSKVIAVSEAVERELSKIFSPEKIVKIYNGIDIEKFSTHDKEKLKREFRFEHNIPFDAPFIGTVGELKELKGQRDFVLAANEIAQKFPEAHFAIIGRDNSLKKDFRRELKRLVKVFNLENRFLWLDWVEDISTLLSALDVFVSASHSESFGLAILEAMANKTPIVATETEGAKELLQNNFSGKLVAVKNPVQISEAVCEILSDKNLSETLGKNAGQTAARKFSLERMIEEAEKVYGEIRNPKAVS